MGRGGFRDLSAKDKELLGKKFAKKLRGSLLNGVYSVVNLPPEERRRSARAQTRCRVWAWRHVP